MSFTAKIDADIKGFETGVDKASQAINKLQSTVESKLTAIGTSFQNIGAKASILSAALVGVGAKAFLMAADFQDALGATEQIFKDSSGVIKDWSDNLSTSYGISKKEALDYANIMGTMLQNIGGMSEEMAGKTAGNLIELAGDLTAMFGGQTSDAVRALTGALKGNNSMLDNYGIAANDAMVKAKALAMGLSDGTGELSLQAKQAATLAIIMEQTASTQGQAAREADGASGSMRALKTEITNLSTELGSVLLPVITPIVSKLRDMAAAFGSLSPETQKMMVVVVGVAAAFAPLMVVIGKVITLLPVLKTGFIGLVTALTGPLGVVLAIAAGVIALTSYANSAKKVITQQEILNSVQADAVNNTRAETDEIKKLRNVLDDANSSYKEKKYALDRLKSIVPDYHASLTNEGKLINNNAKALDTYVKKLVITEKIKLLALKSTKASEEFNAFMEKNSDVMRNLLNKQVNGEGLLAGEKAALEISTRLAKNVDVIEKSIEGLQKQLTDVPVSSAENIITNTENNAKKAKDKVEELRTSIENLNSIPIPKTPLLNVDQINPLSGLSMTDYAEKYRQTAEAVKEITIDLNQYIADAVVSMSDAISNALVNGDNVLKAIGSSLLGTLGKVMVDLGKMTLMAGVGIEAVKKALTSLNGVAAIAAGAELIAIGSLFSAGASKLGRSMGSAGGYASSPTMNSTTSPVAPNYRGAYTDNEVVFKIGTNELVGVLSMAQNRNNRL